MNEMEIVEALHKFVTGNTLVLLYVAVSIVRKVVVPISKHGRELSALIKASTEALNSSSQAHSNIESELRGIKKALLKTPLQG